MKRCPTCNRTYTDETLTYCLADGALLSAPYTPEATLYNPAQHTTPPPTEVLPFSLTGHQPLPKKHSLVPVYLIIAALTLIMAGGILVLKLGRKDTPPSSQATRYTPSAQPADSDGRINAFVTEINTFTDEVVRKVDSAPTPSQGVDDAQKYMDLRKADLREKFNAVKNIGEDQVSEETKKRMQDNFYNDGMKIGQLTARYGSDPVVKSKLKKLTQDFLDLFKM